MSIWVADVTTEELILESWMNHDFSQWQRRERVMLETLNEIQMDDKMNDFSNYLFLSCQPSVNFWQTKN